MFQTKLVYTQIMIAHVVISFFYIHYKLKNCDWRTYVNLRAIAFSLVSYLSLLLSSDEIFSKSSDHVWTLIFLY